MNNKLLLTVLTTAFTLAGYAQQTIRCFSKEAIDYQESVIPGYKMAVEKAFLHAKAHGGMIQKSGHTYTIPVVVHVVYNTDAQNLPDSVIFNQIALLNEDFRRMNPDTVNMRADFNPIAGNPKIKFQLATIDATGNPTTGIIRRQTNLTTFGSLFALLGNFDDLERVKSSANGGSDPWDQTRYLNIWVCNMSINLLGQETTALLGYATPPANLPNWPPGSNPGLSDGVVIQYQCFGSNNPNPLEQGGQVIEVLGRTVTHEVGHYLGLRHIWGDGDCTQEDGIDDTPNASNQSNFDCDASKNTCLDAIEGLGDLPDMIENYMDYSAESCQNSFTKGQVELMHGVLENQRYDLVHNNPAALPTTESFVFSLYPNPTSGIIYMNAQSAIERVTVLTLDGKVLYQQEVNGTFLVIDSAHLEEGAYLIFAESNTGITTTQRFVRW